MFDLGELPLSFGGCGHEISQDPDAICAGEAFVNDGFGHAVRELTRLYPIVVVAPCLKWWEWSEKWSQARRSL